MSQAFADALMSCQETPESNPVFNFVEENKRIIDNLGITCDGKPYVPKLGYISRTQYKINDFGQGIPELVFGPVACGGKPQKFFIEIGRHDKEACCNNRPTAYAERTVSFGIEAKMYCKGFYTIPFLAEVGLKGGLQLSGGLGGEIGLHVPTCDDHGCVKGSIAAVPFLSIYAETIGAEAEGGVRWSPSVQAKYCDIGTKENHFSLKLIPNNINLYYKVEIGWASSQTGEKEIYRTKKSITLLGGD